MQLDMHYYGTYAMARASGLTIDACKIIATAAQFIDDNAEKDHIEFVDGGRIDKVATAHHAIDIDNTKPEDQRQVWVPFHFLPGNQGSSFTERLICKMDSDIAREMVAHNLSHCEKARYNLELLGVTAHVYADTFSHYGFSGISSRQNKIKPDSFKFYNLNPDLEDTIISKAVGFFKRYKEKALNNFRAAILNELAALGHGGVATYPDRPYLDWSFEYEDRQLGEIQRHNNPQTFLKGCEALHKMFCDFGDQNPEFVEAGIRKSFNNIKNRVEPILNFQGMCDERIAQWQKVLNTGVFTKEPGETIPEYDQNEWHQELAALNNRDQSSEALDSFVYRFFQAASFHRHYVLRELLPSHGLVVA